jgi:hypothetical protein
MRVPVAGALLLLAAAGCSAPVPRGACEGLVYTDAGLTREQYAPCAKAMVAKLDELWEDLQAIHDTKLSKADRLRSRQHCLATTSELARMWKQAGGSSKLVSMAWSDTDWNRFNYNVDASRTFYVSMCYYGAAAPMPTEMESVHVEARRFVAALR